MLIGEVFFLILLWLTRYLRSYPLIYYSKESAEFLKPIIEEICPKPKDDDAAAAAL